MKNFKVKQSKLTKKEKEILLLMNKVSLLPIKLRLCGSCGSCRGCGGD